MGFKSACRFVALVCLMCFAVVVKSSAQPLQLPTSIFSLNSNLCAGVSGNPLTDGGPVVQSTCQSAAFQTFSLRPYGGQARIIVQNSNQCLSVSGGSTVQGAPIVQTSCQSSTVSQWYVKPLGSGFQIVNYSGGMCLSVSHASTNVGTPLVQWPCGPSTNLWQLWGFSAPASGLALFSHNSGLCLDSANGTVQNPCSTASTTEPWTVVPYQNSYRIIVPASGNCLGITYGNAGQGLPFTQTPCVSDGGPNDYGQRWYFYTRGSTFEVANGVYPWCLEMDATTAGGAPVQGSCASTQNQLWALRTLASMSPNVAGTWGPVISLPLVPVAMSDLPNGKVLMWSADDTLSQTGPNLNSTYTAIFDPTTGTSTENYVVSTNHDMFCPGTGNLPDGRVFINGGASNFNTTIYDSVTNSWTADKLMNIGRGYEGDTVMPTGNVFTIGGSWPAGNGGKTAEMWNSSTGWTLIPGLPDNPVTGPDPQGALTGDNHVWLFATGSNMVFHAGPTADMHWFDTSGSGIYYDAGNRGDDNFSIAGVAVMAAPGKIFKAGGSTSYGGAAASNATYTIDITNGAVVTKRNPLLYPRIFASGVVLPTGDVMVTGGQTFGAQFSDTNPVMSPEVWNSQTSTFTELAPQIVPRTYHSVALLMPDARVLTGGGGLCVGPCSVNHPDVQIYTPPYLLNSDGSLKPRLSILSAPSAAAHGVAITVTTSGPVAYFTMVRMSSITHTVNNDQRRVVLTPSLTGTNQYTMTIPTGTASVLAGYWMLFAMDSNGVPSVSTPIQILQ